MGDYFDLLVDMGKHRTILETRLKHDLVFVTLDVDLDFQRVWQDVQAAFDLGGVETSQEHRNVEPGEHRQVHGHAAGSPIDIVNVSQKVYKGGCLPVEIDTTGWIHLLV